MGVVGLTTTVAAELACTTGSAKKTPSVRTYGLMLQPFLMVPRYYSITAIIKVLITVPYYSPLQYSGSMIG